MFLIRGSTRILRNSTINSLKKYQRCVSHSNADIFRYYTTAADYKIDLKVNNLNLHDYISKLQQEYTELTQTASYASNPRYIELQPIINILTERNVIVSNISTLKELIDSEDKDISQMAKDEKVELEQKLKHLDDVLLEALLPVSTEESFDSIVLEIQAGVGGQEAMLFAQEIFQMYSNFISNKGKS